MTILQSLHSFLRNGNISKSHLGGWALAKPCQIIPLAKIVVENSMGLAVFNSLAELPEFVDATLAVKPLWLESHLGKTTANTVGDSSTDHLIDCAALVSFFASTNGTLHSWALQLMQAAALAVTDCPNEANLRRLSELCNAQHLGVLYRGDSGRSLLSVQGRLLMPERQQGRYRDFAGAGYIGATSPCLSDPSNTFEELTGDTARSQVLGDVQETRPQALL